MEEKKIDVIIPAYKPDEQFKTLLNRLMKQTTPENYVLLTGKAHELKKYYEDVNSGKIPNVAIKDTKAHTIKSLQNLIRENDFIEAEEVKDTPIEDPKENGIHEW